VVEQEPSLEVTKEKRGWLAKAPGILALLTWLGMAAMWLVVGGLFFYFMLFAVL
jgi:hypothetical protein